jgi:hypothetical protein
LINLLFIVAFVAHHYFVIKIQPRRLNLYVVRLLLVLFVFVIVGAVIVPVLEAADVPVVDNIEGVAPVELPSIWFDMDYAG